MSMTICKQKSINNIRSYNMHNLFIITKSKTSIRVSINVLEITFEIVRVTPSFEAHYVVQYFRTGHVVANIIVEEFLARNAASIAWWTAPEELADLEDTVVVQVLLGSVILGFVVDDAEPSRNLLFWYSVFLMEFRGQFATVVNFRLGETDEHQKGAEVHDVVFGHCFFIIWSKLRPSFNVVIAQLIVVVCT